MHTRTLRPDAVGVTAAVAVAFAGTLGTFLLARLGRFSGWSLLALAAVAATSAWFIHARRTLRGPDGATDILDLSDWGIRHYRDDLVQSAIAWSDLEEVLVVTTREGEAEDTLHLVLNGTSGASVVVPHFVAVESGVLTELEQRLAGYDTKTFFDAIMHHGTDVFVVWRAERAAVNTPVKLDWQVRKQDDRPR